MTPSVEQLQELYRSADRVRCSFANIEAARTNYARYVDFVAAHAPAGATLLDVGCGTGWSSYFFAERGFHCTGVDLNPAAFETPGHDLLTLAQGSGLELPFADGTFDAVAAHQTLEHIPDPVRMLRQMARVLRPGGVLSVVGPNLVSVGNCLRALVEARKNRPLHRIVWRGAGMPRHPFGNTVPESIWQLFVTFGRIVGKSLRKTPAFLMREPDLRPPFHGDNDAVYLCNPLDLAQFFRAEGFEVLRSAALGRSNGTRMLAGGTWVAVRKPRPGKGADG